MRTVWSWTRSWAGSLTMLGFTVGFSEPGAPQGVSERAGAQEHSLDPVSQRSQVQSQSQNKPVIYPAQRL